MQYQATNPGSWTGPGHLSVSDHLSRRLVTAFQRQLSAASVLYSVVHRNASDMRL